MTTQAAHEKELALPDFRAQLRLAMQNAVTHQPEDPLGNGDAAERFRDLDDDYVISFLHDPSDNQVETDDPNAYLTLLMQAAEVLDGSPDLEGVKREYLEKAATHELKHGEEAARFGNSDTISYYGVEFVEYEDGILDFWPYHFTSGPLKKVHHAWCAAAPEDRSDTDMDIVRSLGYGEDIESLKARAEDEPPVEEGWERVKSREEIIRAMKSLALKTSAS